jgi:CheY-like chemotaxis protein
MSKSDVTRSQGVLPMSIEIVTKYAEESLLSEIDRLSLSGSIKGIIHLQLSKYKISIKMMDFIFALKPIFFDRVAKIYFCDDEDVFIAWEGEQMATRVYIHSALFKKFNLEMHEEDCKYYNLKNSLEDLKRIFVFRLLNKKEVFYPPENIFSIKTKKLDDSIAKKFNIKSYQMEQFELVNVFRQERKQPEILIVEDHAFSIEILRGILKKFYTIHTATRAKKGIDLYLAHAPDIVFLDINLPDASGHTLGALIKNIDLQAFVVMVTGNNQAEDRARAYENDVKEFIMKPYNPKQITDVVNKFICERSLQAPEKGLSEDFKSVGI